MFPQSKSTFLLVILLESCKLRVCLTSEVIPCSFW
uniref:Uncharacterized protein n=1 Tax=Anguilla anguilla TaxID=7936 RepID=A0A0E9U3L1_ANGAN